MKKKNWIGRFNQRAQIIDEIIHFQNKHSYSENWRLKNKAGGHRKEKRNKIQRERRGAGFREKKRKREREEIKEERQESIEERKFITGNTIIKENSKFQQQ